MTTDYGLTSPSEGEPTLPSQTDELKILSQTSIAAIRERDLKAAMEKILSGLLKLVPFNSGTVHLYQTEENVLEPVLAVGEFKEVFSKTCLPHSGNTISSTLSTRQIIKIDNVSPYEGALFLQPGPFNPSIKFSLMVAPLGVNPEGEGWVLSVMRSNEAPFNDHEFELFQILSSHAASAIENIRLYEGVLREAEAHRKVSDIMMTVGSLKSADQIYQRVANEISRVLEYNCLVFCEVDQEKGLINVIYDSAGISGQVFQKVYRLEGSAVEQVVLSKNFLFSNDSGKPGGDTYFRDPLIDKRELQAFVIFPLWLEGQVISVMLLGSAHSNAFNESKLNFLQILSKQLAVAAENVHLFERLRRTRRQWQITLDAILDSVLMINAADFTILQANRAAAKLADCRPEDLVGKVYRNVFYQVDPCLCNFPLNQIISPGSEFNEEVSGTFSGRIYQRSVYPIFRSDGSVGELVTHIREITATKMMEQQLAQTVRLKAVGEMAAGIAHDFNNSLASILGNVELMLLENTELRTREQLLQLKQAALDGADTVRRIQSFGRKDGRKAYRKFDLNSVVREVVELTRPRWQNQAQQQGIYIGMVLRLTGHLTIFGNSAEIKEAITNLVFNALDAMPQGGTLTLYSHMEQTGSNLVALLQISDTGKGVSGQDKSKIFDPFFTTKGLKGTGLGLSMARQIMAEHEGEIGFESVEGEGTTFFLRLPLVQPDNQHVPQLADQPPAVLKSSSNLFNVLVIDDDQALCSVLQRILHRFGHQVEIAQGGKEGLELFRKSPGEFDLVFTDLSMPEMSGYEVARIMKTLDAHSIIILMTGWGADLNSENLNSRGIDLHITKPYRIADVQKLLERAAELRRERQLSRFTSAQ